MAEMANAEDWVDKKGEVVGHVAWLVTLE